MANTLQELETLREKIGNLDPLPENQDHGTLDYLLKKLALVIRQTFGLSSPYLEDLKKVDFPKDLGLDDIPENQKDQLEYRWVSAQDMVDNIIKIMIEDLTSSQQTSVQSQNCKPVFIVHGTDHQPVNELKAVLKGVNITPVVLDEQPSKGMTIIEKLEEYGGDVGFAFVILTPDDIGVKRQIISECYGAYHAGKDAANSEIIKWAKDLSGPIADFLLDKIQPSIENRARQNVVLEFGYFIGKVGRKKVCCLYKGDLELPSDMHGLCYLQFNTSLDLIKDAIINELRAAGIIV